VPNASRRSESIFLAKPLDRRHLEEPEDLLKCLKAGTDWRISTRYSQPTSLAPPDSSHMSRTPNRFRFIRLASVVEPDIRYQDSRCHLRLACNLHPLVLRFAPVTGRREGRNDAAPSLPCVGLGSFVNSYAAARSGGRTCPPHLGDHPKAAIDDQVKSGHREAA
jgi:hypothetical protein